MYREFTDLLFQRLHAPGESGIHAQTRLALGRFGDQIVSRAASLVDQLPELIDSAADLHLDNETFPVADLLTTQPPSTSPGKPLERAWRSFLMDSAARTGLVAMHGEELRFVHQTVLEYCAARHATRNPAERASVL
ncbi:hypothetical protein ABT052_39630 [Streptomyces sp. NPDC002766]|uniref:hypothetical protein n=1 Tax=unclassified Streptomyces TaxID=2593676 RepID=UPI0033243EC2